MENNNFGQVKISNDVVATIAGLAALEVEGVETNTTFTDKILKNNGVKIQIEEEEVSLDVMVMIDYGVSIPEIALKIQENVKNFLKVIIEKKRFNELNGIIASFTKKLDEINSIKRVEVTSAIEMDENIKQRILEKLQLKLHQNVIAEWKIDTDIIGGLIVKIDDDVIDSSLRCKLENLSKHII